MGAEEGGRVEEEGVGAWLEQEEWVYDRPFEAGRRGTLYEAEAGGRAGRDVEEETGLDSTRGVTPVREVDGPMLAMPSRDRSSSTAAFGGGASLERDEVDREGPNPPRLLDDEDARVVGLGSGFRAEDEADGN